MRVRRFASVASMPLSGSATTHPKTGPPSSMCSAPSSENDQECQRGTSSRQRTSWRGFGGLADRWHRAMENSTSEGPPFAILAYPTCQKYQVPLVGDDREEDK